MNTKEISEWLKARDISNSEEWGVAILNQSLVSPIMEVPGGDGEVFARAMVSYSSTEVSGRDIDGIYDRGFVLAFAPCDAAGRMYFNGDEYDNAYRTINSLVKALLRFGVDPETLTPGNRLTDEFTGDENLPTHYTEINPDFPD